MTVYWPLFLKEAEVIGRHEESCNGGMDRRDRFFDFSGVFPGTWARTSSTGGTIAQ